jgi:hypothetical protein
VSSRRWATLIGLTVAAGGGAPARAIHLSTDVPLSMGLSAPPSRLRP